MEQLLGTRSPRGPRRARLDPRAPRLRGLPAAAARVTRGPEMARHAAASRASGSRARFARELDRARWRAAWAAARVAPRGGGGGAAPPVRGRRRASRAASASPPDLGGWRAVALVHARRTARSSWRSLARGLRARARRPRPPRRASGCSVVRWLALGRASPDRLPDDVVAVRVRCVAPARSAPSSMIAVPRPGAARAGLRRCRCSVVHADERLDRRSSARLVSSALARGRRRERARGCPSVSCGLRSSGRRSSCSSALLLTLAPLTTRRGAAVAHAGTRARLRRGVGEALTLDVVSGGRR